MATTDKYFRIQLHILRDGESALEALSACLNYGIVNTGEGERQTQESRDPNNGSDIADVETFLERNSKHPYYAELEKIDESHPDRKLYKNAFMGCAMHGVSGGSLGNNVRHFKKVANSDPKQVYFTIKADLLWGAIYTARETGMNEFKPLSWLEFRVLAAILSGPGHQDIGYAVLGWESIQARACGFHKKAPLQELVKENQEKAKKWGRPVPAALAGLPPHCQPLGRQTIRNTIDRLEVLGFFARVCFRPETEYSFKHSGPELRELMIKRKVSQTARKSKLAEHREADRVAWESSRKPTNGKPIRNHSPTNGATNLPTNPPTNGATNIKRNTEEKCCNEKSP